MRLLLGLVVVFTYSISAFAVNEPPTPIQEKKGFCESLVTKAKDWLFYTSADLATNRRSWAISQFVTWTMNNPANFREHFNYAVWGSYFMDPKQAVRHDTSYTYSKEIELFSMDAGRTLLNQILPGWEENSQLFFVWPSPISLYTAAKGTLPKQFEPGSLVLMKNGLAHGFIKSPLSQDSRYEAFSI